MAIPVSWSKPIKIPLNELSSELQEYWNEAVNDDSVRLAINNAFARIIDPWVPYLEGPLSQQLNITPEFIEYTVPYATRQYYGDDFNHTKDTHPLATARWDEVAMQTEHDKFMEEVAEILTRRMNGG